MPPTPEAVVQRISALVYDGTNAAAIVDHLSTYYPIDPGFYSIGSEEDGVLQVTTSDPNNYSGLTVLVGDHVVASRPTSIEALSDDAYAAKYRPL